MKSEIVNYQELLYLAEDGNEAAYNELVTTYIQNYRYNFYNQFQTISREEIDSMMYFAVIDAIKSYDHNCKASVPTYFTTCINNKLISLVTKNNKKVHAYMFESEKLQYLQHTQADLTITENGYAFQVECDEFAEMLTQEQKAVFQGRLLGKSVREIAEELNISRTKVNMIQERLKTKAKQYGLVEKNF
ncbi:MAG: RNA polymerase sigma factor [Culicoidibacterales bacterium]